MISNLPVVGGMRAIGRVQALVVLFSVPAILLCLESFSPKIASILLSLLLLELIPGEWVQRVPIDPGWFKQSPLSSALANGPPVLVLPQVNMELMVALADREPAYYGGISSRLPPGQEVLEGSIAAGAPTVDVIIAAGARRVLARTARTVRETAAIPGAILLGSFEWGSLFAVPPLAAPLLIDRDSVSNQVSAPWPTLELVARRGGILSVRRLDACHLQEEFRLGPLSISHALRLQGNEVRTLSPRAGDVIVHHESRLAAFRLPELLRPEDRIELVCATNGP